MVSTRSLNFWIIVKNDGISSLISVVNLAVLGIISQACLDMPVIEFLQTINYSEKTYCEYR